MACHCYEASMCYCDGYEEDLEICHSALQEAIKIIHGLADQQAMPDDWYVEPLERISAVCERIDP